MVRVISFSVVINSYNRAERLADALLGAAALRYPNFEIIVVNGPSTDHTSEILKPWQDHIKLLTCETPNLAHSRNIAIAAAAGEIVAFLDDDAIPHPTWLTELSYAYADPRVAGAGGFTQASDGLAFQARKNLGDRYGNAHGRPDDYDERPLNHPGTPLYPSLLGTNSSFRVQALRKIGGFDPAFAYFLDETDVCLRLVDAGHRIVYVPDAIVFHGFAPSSIRNERRIPQSVKQLAISKSYFIWHHGMRANPAAAAQELTAYETKWREDIIRLYEHKEIDLAHRVRLERELAEGLLQGRTLAFSKTQTEWLPQTPPPTLKPYQPQPRTTLAVLTRTPSPWLLQLLTHLASQNFTIHLLCEAETPSLHFHANIWRHEFPATKGAGEPLAAAEDIPIPTADWCAAIATQFGQLAHFNIDKIASTEREIPALTLLNRTTLLIREGNTAEDLARHPEWQERPLFTHFHCQKLIAQESRAARTIPLHITPADDFPTIAAKLTQ